jgi:hypothetical protein
MMASQPLHGHERVGGWLAGVYLCIGVFARQSNPSTCSFSNELDCMIVNESATRSCIIVVGPPVGRPQHRPHVHTSASQTTPLT